MTAAEAETKTTPVEETPKEEVVAATEEPAKADAAADVTKKSFFATLCSCLGGKTVPPTSDDKPTDAKGDKPEASPEAEATAKDTEKPVEEEVAA